MMRAASSLTNRIFLASTLLATLSLGVVFYFVNDGVYAQAEEELRRDLDDAASLVEQHRTTLTETFSRMARLVADLPRLKAAAETGDPPTVQPIAEEYGKAMNPDLLVVSVPILLGFERPEVLGRLTVGFFMDDRLAGQFKGVTGAEIAFAAQGRVLASSLPAGSRAALSGLVGATGVTTVNLSNEQFLGLARPMQPLGGSSPATLIMRSRTERLRFLNTLRAGLVGALILTVLLATILSYGVARTMTRPLSAVTNAMRDVAATGDLTRKVTLRSRAWDDEDARLLAAAFNTLTESIARFQREAAQKQRLLSLGRLSTVIAHEVRNPLMIIRASLASLWAEGVSLAERREAVADIDEETRRLNRIVTEVLDFAKPIRFDMGEAHVNDICRASSAAALAGESSVNVQLDLDPALPSVVTDSERLRIALINILVNARHAVEAANGHLRADALRRASPEPSAEAGSVTTPGVVLSTRRKGDRI